METRASYIAGPEPTVREQAIATATIMLEHPEYAPEAMSDYVGKMIRRCGDNSPALILSKSKLIGILIALGETLCGEEKHYAGSLPFDEESHEDRALRRMAESLREKEGDVGLSPWEGKILDEVNYAGCLPFSDTHKWTEVGR